MITISAFKWVPEFAQGQVRDLRARWALEEAGLPYKTRLLSQGDQDKPDYRALHRAAGLRSRLRGADRGFQEGGVSRRDPGPRFAAAARDRRQTPRRSGTRWRRMIT